MTNPSFDCLVIGGGPAGLTAAIYLARYRLAVQVVDASKSRAEWIARSYNVPGFPGGIAGSELLARMRDQASNFGAALVQGFVTRIDPVDHGFQVDWGSGSVFSNTVLLATGLTNRRPQIEDGVHQHALAQRLLRYCPVCDGYEATDKNIGVLGTQAHGLAEAVFLRAYSQQVTLLAPDGSHDLTEAQRNQALELGVTLYDGPCGNVSIEGAQIAVATPGGPMKFDCLYPALGSDVHVQLAVQTGAAMAGDGTLTVDRHQRTSIAGLYAAGDVVLGLDQISHAMGEGGVAATAIRNDIAAQRNLLRTEAHLIR